jgi:glucose-1-phosphate thymidylyltransferase
MTVSERRPVIGIIPAAGRATRLPNRVCSKELLPVGYTRDAARPRAISEYLVDAMVDAGADRICMVVAPDKQDIVRFYGSGEAHGVPIAYLCQEQQTGMSDAIDLACPWLRDATVLMGMPDTIVKPDDSLSRIRALLEREQCDIALAVAPTDEPARLGPVHMDAGGRVLEVMDKPVTVPHNMVWTVACWAPRFTEFLHAQLAVQPRAHPEAPLGLIFQDAILAGFDVRALAFADGRYIDAGTVAGLAAAQQLAAGLTPAGG